MTQGHFKNGLLQRFDSETIKRLDLKAVDLPVNHEIEFPGNRIEHLFFIEEGMASMTTTFDDGFQVEVGLAGWESVQGASVLMGTKKSLNRVYMQVAGHGYTTTTYLAAEEFNRCSVFQDLTLRYLQAQFIQSAQTAGCNARHSVQQRLARWLLLCADRNGGRILPLSHEYMADMLGANRTTVSVVAGQFQSLNLIQYSRGKINLLDLAGLEKMACECYRVVRDHLANLTEYDRGVGCTGQVNEQHLKVSSERKSVERIPDIIEASDSIQNVDIVRGLISDIAKALVDQPEAVQTEVLPDGGGVILRLKVAQGDLGKVIGKQGRTARSLRTILATASMKSRVRFSLDIQTE